ncbi:type II secretion system F family protein [Candidatus Contubernalis alkaliaceticus]|uniref:type II secretion system F family protein n=1 Tax=Candidatus Contubernalis alkaliaceticus TaxID=338645 RepID=UPI001F4BE11C|nr:type II secretion system F family protein [Candidatus Contubernalis alkalaceticus]UNC93451.1 type II secretion system F family protein [Candidatus Contubernalis alkalaceticus]
MLHLLVLSVSFLTVVLFTVGIYNFLFASRLAVLQRLETYTLDEQAFEEIEANRGEGIRRELLKMMGMLGKFFSRGSKMADLQITLIQAHMLMRAEEFIGLVLFFGAGVFFFIYLLMGNVWAASLIGLLSFKLPGIYINIKKNKRMLTLNLQLPEALNLISNGLRAGYSFTQAMAVVSREMQPPISYEFGRVLKENALGKTMDDALMNFSRRTDNEDIDLFITALLIQRQVGGNLAEILDNIGHTIRERVRIQGEIKTLTAQGRMSAIIIVALPIGVAAFISVLNPEYMLPLIQEPLGRIMIGMAALSQFIGIVFIRRIVNIEI